MPQGNTPSTISLTYGIDSTAYAVIGDKYVPVTATGSLSISASNYVVSSTVATYSAAFVLDSTGNFKVYQSSAKGTQPTVASTDIVLSYVDFGVKGGTFSGLVHTPVTINNSGGNQDNSFVDLTHGTSNTNGDYHVTDLGNGSIQVTFVDTANSAVTNKYSQYRRFKMFYKLISVLDSANKDKMVMVLNPSSNNTKYSLSGMSITNIVTDATQNKSFVLNTGLTTGDLSYVLNGFLCFYTLDNEFILGTNGIKSTAGGPTLNTDLKSVKYGIAGPESNIYSDYYNIHYVVHIEFLYVIHNLYRLIP